MPEGVGAAPGVVPMPEGPAAAPAAPVPALLVIDMQNTLVAMAYRAAGTVAAIARLQERARAAGAPVVLVQQGDEELEPGTDGWRIVPCFGPRPR